VFTIHNLAYQGIFDAGWLVRLGLSPTLLRVDGLEYWGRLSFLKGGILFSRLLTTVSPQYAREIQGPDLGFGFEGILAGRSGDLVGILNGIDYDQWDPSRDPHLPEPFDASNLKGKTAAKRTLLARYGFPVKRETLERPLVGMVSRMVDQKGFDLLSTVAAQLPQAGATFVVLGSGERRYEEQWREMATRHPDAIGVYIGFEEDLAHLIEGGSDLFLMPSRFEPCGLNQMYSLRYGTVPVVRATGGLRDTVQPVDPASGEGTGFVFEEYSADALWRALQAAIGLYRDKTRWRRIQRAGMRQDFSWERSARAYEAVYERARVTN
jgi:starch synthase